MMEQTSPNKEANRERFVRIVERRVNTILNNLDSLAKCSNRRNYEYTDTDVKRIFREIEKKCKEIRILFDGRGNTKVFKLE